jgi:signal transduction histidine kinase
VVRESTDATGQLFREKEVALSVSVCRPAPRIKADRDRLIQVLINLLSNAVKFCPAGRGRVEVRVFTEGEELRVDVKDNGPGIGPADHERIFEKFRQVGDTLTGKPEGTGLGLPISRRIVEHFGGRLWVASELGKGATFSFALPLHAVQAVAAPVEGQQAF